MKIYKCIYCNFESNRLFNYNKHLKTLKHIKNSSKKAPFTGVSRPKNGCTPPENGAKQSKKKVLQCTYCKKNISHKGHIARHHRVCKEKMKFHINEKRDREVKKILKKQRKILKRKNKLKKQRDAYRKEKLELERELLEFMKQATLKNNRPDNINNNTFNMFYILNNFTQAFDFKERMQLPMTTEEKDELYRIGPNHACIEYIKKRCIDGISLEQRPIHCVDGSRNKYLVRQGGAWIIDNSGKLIIREAFDQLKDIYLVKLSDMTSNKNIDEVSDRVNQLLVIENKGKYKILGILNNMVLLKNNMFYS